MFRLKSFWEKKNSSGQFRPEAAEKKLLMLHRRMETYLSHFTPAVAHAPDCSRTKGHKAKVARTEMGGI